MFDIEEIGPISGTTLYIESEVTKENPSGASFQNVNFIKEYINIRKGISEERDKYYKLRELKERWNIFKYVVCCVNDTSDSFYALILGATAYESSGEFEVDPIPTKSKAFKYAWKEVQFIPKAYEGISGDSVVFVYPEFGGSGNTSGCTCGIPTGLSLAAGITGVTFSQAWPAFDIFLPHGARSGGFSGITTGFTFFAEAGPTFINSQVVPYFPAFNINEFTNYEWTENGGANKYIGPGINANLETFPKGNKLIPVGYMPSFDDPCKHQFHGQIVKMQQIPTKNMQGLNLSDNDLKAAPVIYVFDVQNAVEGQCEECPEEP
jgi:hypothetical protein